MKIPERTGKWIEMEASTETKDEIILRVPNGVWAGWTTPVYLNGEDLASFLRSVGWQVTIPQPATR
jgi:hypothetical protein